MTSWMNIIAVLAGPTMMPAMIESTTLAAHSTRVPIQKGWRLMRPSKFVKR
jgi:hypothetical protein